MSYINELNAFKNEHKDCKISLIPAWDKESIALNCDKHHVFIKITLPFMCRAINGNEALECALAGYCKREYACNN